jgi:hypothetical protein
MSQKIDGNFLFYFWISIVTLFILLIYSDAPYVNKLIYYTLLRLRGNTKNTVLLLELD